MIHPTANKSIFGKITWHLSVFGGAVFISFFFSLVLTQKIFHAQWISMLALTFVQLEIFIWLGTWFFQSVKTGPRFKKQIILKLAQFFVLVLVIATLFFAGLYTTIFFMKGGEFENLFSSFLQAEMKAFFIATLIGFALGALFFFYTQWADALNREQKLTEEKLIFQYETLKNQVNPHFLFNSLNSLSSMVRSNPEMSEKFIQKLSAIYRNILENTEKELVPLSTEMELVNDFFYLQKIRSGEKIELKIEFNQPENVEVLPVSLQLLLENALKHNSATHKQPLEIIIHFEGLDKIVVRNNLQVKTQLNPSSRIGLKNLAQRSLLILNREIEVQETADEFVVKIPVKIN